MKSIAYHSFQYNFVGGLSEDLEHTLVHEYGVDELDIEDIFTSTQLSKIEKRPHYLYAAFQFPEFDKSIGTFRIKEVHCIISDVVLIIIDKNEHKHSLQFNNLKDSLFDKNISSYDLFYEMLDFSVVKDFRAISKLRLEIQELEINIFSFKAQSDLVRDILMLKRNLAIFYSVIAPLTSVIIDLQVKYTSHQNFCGIEKLDNTLDKLKKMINNLDTMNKHADLLSESNNTLIAQSTNQVIRALTSISILAILPTMMFAFFGMNVYFGWRLDSDLRPLLGIMGLAASSTALIYFYFKKRKWL